MYEETTPANPLVNLLDAGTILATGAGEASWCTAGSSTGEATRSTTSCAVEFLHDGAAGVPSQELSWIGRGNEHLLSDGFELLLFLVVLLLGGLLRVIEPRDSLIDSGLELALVGRIKLAGELLISDRVTQVVGI